jgi:two-component system response regulator PilR (NtrC family)
VGGTEEKTVNVRFISATNKDLEKAVIGSRFREDLFFRLNVIQIPMPPLRERSGDLPILSQYFLEKYSREVQKDVRKISAFAMNILGEYSFPGNVRELENIIERSVALETSNIVLPESLNLGSSVALLPQAGGRPSFERGAAFVPDKAADLGLSPEGVDLDRLLADKEREYIQKALEMTYGSQKKAAELLGVTYKSLRHRISKLKI